jgi:hypothetical protein
MIHREQNSVKFEAIAATAWPDRHDSGLLGGLCGFGGGRTAPGCWRSRSWACFGFGAVAPTIATTVPTFSAVTSRKFGGSTSGWRGAAFSPTAVPAKSAFQVKPVLQPLIVRASAGP